VEGYKLLQLTIITEERQRDRQRGFLFVVAWSGRRERDGWGCARGGWAKELGKEGGNARRVNSGAPKSQKEGGTIELTR